MLLAGLAALAAYFAMHEKVPDLTPSDTVKPITGGKLTLTRATDQELALHAGEAAQADSVNLNRCPITDKGLESLRGLENIRHLNLSNTKITDAGLDVVATMSNLEDLGLNFTHITGAGLKKLAPLKRLRKLGLGFTRVGDEGVANLQSLESLQVLHLNNVQVTDAGLAPLKNLNLTALDLNFTSISNKGLEQIKDFKALQRLYLVDDRKVTDAGLDALKSLATLQTVNAAGTDITEAGAKKFKKAKPDCEVLTDSDHRTLAGD